MVSYAFSDYESDRLHDMNSVQLFLKLKDNKMLPTRIVIKVRAKGRTNPKAPYGKCYSVTPEHGLWSAAKRAFRSTWAVVGEVDADLGMEHLNTGQYAIAAYRNFHTNPIRKLLLPFLRGVTNINDPEKTSIFGVTGVLTSNTPLTTSACWLRLRHVLGTLDWYEWTPEKPLYEGSAPSHNCHSPAKT